MNIIPINNNQKEKSKIRPSTELFKRMQNSLSGTGISFEKSVRLAKTLAPILQDQSSNERHINTITSKAPIQDKVIATLMLGFPKNQQVLALLKEQLFTGTESLRIASAIAISQMRTNDNADKLCEILLNAYENTASTKVKRTISQVAVSLLDRKAAKLIQVMFSHRAE